MTAEPWNDSVDEDERDDGDGLEPDYSNAILLVPRKPFAAWVQQLQPVGQGDDDVAEDLLRAPPTVYLIPELDHPFQVAAWLNGNYHHLFEYELRNWSPDEDTWPQNRSFELFTSWFEVGVSTHVVDCTRIEPPRIDCAPVSPAAVVEALADLPDELLPFLDLTSGTIVTLTPEQTRAAVGDEEPGADKPEAWRTAVVRAREAFDAGTYVRMDDPLPEDDPELREAFASSVQVPPTVRNRLFDSLHGRKAAKRFLETVESCGLGPRWVAFQRDAAVEAMREWLKAMRVPTTEDGD